MRAEIKTMRDEIEQRIVVIEDDEMPNLKTLSNTYSTMTPTAARVAVIREMDENMAVKIISMMKNDKMSAIPRGEGKTPDRAGEEPLAKRAARISDKLPVGEADQETGGGEPRTAPLGGFARSALGLVRPRTCSAADTTRSNDVGRWLSDPGSCARKRREDARALQSAAREKLKSFFSHPSAPRTLIARSMKTRPLPLLCCLAHSCFMPSPKPPVRHRPTAGSAGARCRARGADERRGSCSANKSRSCASALAGKPGTGAASGCRDLPQSQPSIGRCGMTSFSIRKQFDAAKK